MTSMTRREFLINTARLGVIGLAAYPFFIERYIIQTNIYRIEVPNLPNAFRGLRIVHLTDLHYGFLVPLGIIRSVVERANALKPDIIVCTGDYVHKTNSNGEIDTVWPVLSGLNARYGVYSVLGNHDHWADTDLSLYRLKKSGQDLRHKTTRIDRDGESLWLAGAGDLREDHMSLDRLLQNVPDGDCRIVLAHNPDTADTHYSSRADLLISGHTHGGQVVIPFIGPPVLPVRNKTYSSGLKMSRRGGKVFISKGIGWTIYPVRFNCYPEIAVLELYPGRTQDETTRGS